MIDLHERMLPTSAGVEPVTSWSPVGRASNWATEDGWIIDTLVISIKDIWHNKDSNLHDKL